MQTDKIQIGNCFTYNLTTDKKEQYGFVVIDIRKGKKRGFIECALVIPDKKEIQQIDDLKKGLIYARQIYSPHGNKLGIFCYMFNWDNLNILINASYIGDIQLDKNKFMIGSGETASSEPLFSKILANSREAIFEEFDTIRLQEIVSD